MLDEGYSIEYTLKDSRVNIPRVFIESVLSLNSGDELFLTQGIIKKGMFNGKKGLFLFKKEEEIT